MTNEKNNDANTTDLVLVPESALAPSPDSIATLVDAWRSSLSEATRMAYAVDIDQFARWAGAPSAAVAIEQLLRGRRLDAEVKVLTYLRHLLEEQKLSPATVARRRAALRSVVRFACGLGLI